jgi:hypothetical protein
MKRINYKKENDLLISPPMLANKHYVFAVLDLKTNTFEVKTLDDNGLVNTGKGPSVQMLKIKAKRALKALGVVFESEVRPKLTL